MFPKAKLPCGLLYQNETITSKQIDSIKWPDNHEGFHTDGI